MSLTSIENNQFRIYTAQKFIEGLQSQSSENNLYVWIGKVTAWSNDSTPPQPQDTVAARISSFADMMVMKRVSPADVCLVIPRYNWTSSTLYSQYSDLGAVAGGIYYDQYEPSTLVAPFYVITTDNNVYKCLDNNGNSASSVMPTGTSVSPVTLADHYTWKFMFQVSYLDSLNFLSDGWIPIHQLTYNDGSAQWAVQTTAALTPGTIEKIQVINVGSGYTSTPTVTVLGDGVGCRATAVISGNTVIGIAIVTKGHGYSHATVTIGGPGSSATAHAIISPPGGHGSNDLAELGAMYAMVDVSLNYGESGKITTDNDYRKFGLLLNPLFYGSQYYYYPLIDRKSTNVTLTSVTGTFDPDVLVTGVTSGVTGNVVDYNIGGTNVIIYYISSNTTC